MNFHDYLLPRTQNSVTNQLLHFTSLHFTSLHFTSLHFTSLHFTSLNWTVVKVKVILRPTVSRPVCLGVKALIWGLRPDFYFCQTVAGLLMWGALSDDRTVLPFTIAAGPRQRRHFWVLVPRDSWPYFTVSDSRLLQPGGPGPHIYSDIPQEQGDPVIPPGTGFPSSRLLRPTGLRWRYSNPPDWTVAPFLFKKTHLHGTHGKHRLLSLWMYMFTAAFPGNRLPVSPCFCSSRTP
jgi:hypothetical protein